LRSDDHTHPEVPAGLHPEFREERERPEFGTWWVGGWLSAIIVVAFTVLWCLLIYLVVPERPVGWRYGVAPYVPGQSIVSTKPPPAGPPPKQVVLPQTGGSASGRPR